MSGVTGAIGTEIGIAQAGIEVEAAKKGIYKLSERASFLKVAKILKNVGRYNGVGAGVAQIAEDVAADKVSVGTFVKVGIGVGTAFAYGAFGPVGLAYGILDLAVFLGTGTSITDRVGNIVDEQIKKTWKK